jgi:2,3-bisphosphoglycerate-independent phosphoglycerate mutase
MESIQHIADKALLIILDGYGINDNDVKNAVKDANTPFLDQLFKDYPFTTIEAGGVKVGLPKGVAGNSEVGHMNLGAGKPVRQDLVCINEDIEKDALKDREHFGALIAKAKSLNNRVHLMGLLSDGGVHSHIDHLKHIAYHLNEAGVEVFFHAFMDGRDTPPQEGGKYLAELAEVPYLTNSSMGGRSIGMDRDRRWEKIEHAYKTIIGEGLVSECTPEEYLASEYEKGIYDEFITPTLFHKDFALTDKDCLFFINFRPDRAIQMSLAMTLPDFEHFKRPVLPAHYLCMTPYVPDEIELPILFEKEKIRGGLSEYLSERGKKQLKIAETEKYAHVTFFFNGGEKKPFENEEHYLINSPKDVATYDLKPEMSAFEVTDKLHEKIMGEEKDFYLVNFANSDMVGHTGNYEAAIKALEALDQCVEKLVTVCGKKNVAVLLTADHGNSDQMVYDDGTPHTSHTKALVPFCVIHPKLKSTSWEINGTDHSLMDVAPTVLSCMGIERPHNFEGLPIFK